MDTLPSFRDPDASLSIERGRVIRAVRPASAERFAELLADPLIRTLLAEGRLIGTRRLGTGRHGGEETLYEHDLVPFVAYPVEWPPAMLARAAAFTLELALELLGRGYWLKDATPNNVLFNAATPVFVDLPSIEPRPAGAYLWPAQDQFERTFLLPLIANLEAGIPLAWSLQDPVRGIGHAEVARVSGPARFVRPSLLRSVTIPAALTSRLSERPHREARPMRNDDQARFVLERMLTANLRRVRRLAAAIDARARSAWGRYTQTREHYSEQDIAAKRRFVTESVARVGPEWVLDIGANTGEFSLIAADSATVVAIDSDEASVSRIFREAERTQANVLPISGDIARPTPATGWQNAEASALLDRAKGRFDLVLMLAVVHHLRATAGIPCARILDLVRELSTRYVLLEHVPLSDPMFRRLARGREALYGDIERPAFEAELKRRFAIETSVALSNGRTLYLARCA